MRAEDFDKKFDDGKLDIVQDLDMTTAKRPNRHRGRLKEDVKMDKDNNPANTKDDILRITVTGGGPVGLSFALLLESLMDRPVEIKVYDGRWTKREDSNVVWRNKEERNPRRHQVVTIQSRQYLKLPRYVQDRIFQHGYYSEMWPKGPDSIEAAPRNIRISYLEDHLLEIANEKTERIELITEKFNAEDRIEEIKSQHLLVICEGAGSRTRDYYKDKFGKDEKSAYSLTKDEPLQDFVLGLRVKSDLADPMAVLLTVVQNRFLLNSMQGEGFLNMRLTDEESKEVSGFNPDTREFTECIQSHPCLLIASEEDSGKMFKCPTHGTTFFPQIMKTSKLWPRVIQGLELFGIKEENLTAVTGFRLDMIHRPRFTVELYPPVPDAGTPGTFGALLGDAANAFHFWPGRGLNSGLASAISLARCLKEMWRGRAFRHSDFLRHEGVMSMLQYKHKHRAWRSMVVIDEGGEFYAIKDKIKQGIAEGENVTEDAKGADVDELVKRLGQIRERLKNRIVGVRPDDLPNDDFIRRHLESLDSETLRTLVVSGSWDTSSVSGEEVDVDRLFPDAGQSDTEAPGLSEFRSEVSFDWVEIPNENPKFWISRVPVTNQQYKEFVDAEKYSHPDHWDNGCIPNGKEDHPVVNVSLTDAKNFCEWCNVDLPTDLEWVEAACGPEPRKYQYPLKQKPNKRNCNFGNNNTTPVYHYGNRNGDSIYGVLDMAGNVWEWTLRANSLGAILRGGDFKSTANALNVTFSDNIKTMLEEEKYMSSGFRVVSHQSPISHQGAKNEQK